MRCHHQVWNKDACAVSVHVRHASAEVQLQCVNVVIGVVLGELHFVRVVPVVVCDDAVVRRTLVLIAFTVAIVFIVAIFMYNFAVLEVECLQGTWWRSRTTRTTAAEQAAGGSSSRAAGALANSPSVTKAVAQATLF